MARHLRTQPKRRYNQELQMEIHPSQSSRYGKEGDLTRAVERQTARIPSGGYLLAALSSMTISAVLKATRRDEAALFVGQWAAPFLILGMYNKLVKQLGSEGENLREAA
ncbi:MAG: hypothetical protein ACYC6M_11490 [Terriglobales bacterium]